MNDEILKWARDCGGVDITANGYMTFVGTQTPEFLERFYKAAYNKAIKDALYVVPSNKCYDAIKELEMK